MPLLKGSELLTSWSLAQAWQTGHWDFKMVLQERIELSTSPLPRECSTTELLQRTGRDRATAAALAQDPNIIQ